MSDKATFNLGMPKDADNTRSTDPFELDDHDDEHGLLDWD